MRKLKLNSGGGYSGIRELGLFEVKYGNTFIRFRVLTIARHFYDNLEVEKSIWQVEPIPKLLECHSYKLQQYERTTVKRKTVSK